ncbi:DUF1648 domain-containing protein [Microbacterium hominis]|uniref:DUF1648 domain-containing protein n=1 Tax=Microbacterium hominis TaxID=162426 RepID=A0A7D4U407_9MICO|nr:DUF1648 domain-containing protein [Microbacterium hominis]QKJ19045.1 DUF1648 domain-containing protein [Microbacterium hominis]
MTDHRPAGTPHTIGRFVAVALILPITLTVIAVVVQLVALPRVPDVVASHWRASGLPDGFAPSWLNPLMTAVLGLGIPALLALCALPGLRRGDRGASYRLLGSLSAATTVLITVLLTWTLVIQIDVQDPATVELPFWPAILPVFALAVAIGVIAWFAQPRDYPAPGSTAAAAPLALTPGETAVWMRHVSIARAGLIVLVSAVLLIVGLAIGAWVVGADTTVAWILTGVALVLLVLVATTATFHVRVDEHGLAVDSVLGIPRFRVPLERIEHASVIEVDPMGQFGGWGLRLAADGRFGVVLRTGEAIEVARTGKKPFVVTVDDAATGAALLEGLRARADAE